LRIIVFNAVKEKLETRLNEFIRVDYPPFRILAGDFLVDAGGEMRSG